MREVSFSQTLRLQVKDILPKRVVTESVEVGRGERCLIGALGHPQGAVRTERESTWHSARLVVIETIP